MEFLEAKGVGSGDGIRQGLVACGDEFHLHQETDWEGSPVCCPTSKVGCLFLYKLGAGVIEDEELDPNPMASFFFCFFILIIF